jgi:hypothetical protein
VRDQDSELIKAFKEGDAEKVLANSAAKHECKLGPVRFYELRPGEGQAGHPPKDFMGDNVRLLVAEADVVAMLPRAPRQSFITDLDPRDLERLRASTRRGAMRAGLILTNEQCDDIIERNGPEIAQRLLRELVDNRAHPGTA